jgi:hypothetical protein
MDPTGERLFAPLEEEIREGDKKLRPPDHSQKSQRLLVVPMAQLVFYSTPVPLDRSIPKIVFGLYSMITDEKILIFQKD